MARKRWLAGAITMKIKLVLLMVLVVFLLSGCISVEKKQEIVFEYIVDKLPELWEEYCEEDFDCAVSYVRKKWDEYERTP